MDQMSKYYWYPRKVKKKIYTEDSGIADFGGIYSSGLAFVLVYYQTN